MSGILTMMHGDSSLVNVSVPETFLGWKHHRNSTGTLWGRGSSFMEYLK